MTTATKAVQTNFPPVIIEERTKAEVRRRLQTYATADVCQRSGLSHHQMFHVARGFMQVDDETWFILARRMGLV